MYDFLLTPEEQALKKEARAFVREEISSDFLRRMDKNEITYPREFVEKLAARKLLGVRFPEQYGGRGMGWTAEIAVLEEIGCLGIALGCAYSMPSIVGEALNVFGTEEQKQKYLKPYLEGKLVAAEALTEPRGGSDFFGAMTRAEVHDDHFILNGQKRFVVGAEGADFFLVYCRTNFDENAHKYGRLSLLLVDRGPGVETEYLYGLMGCRGGGTGRLVFRDVKVPRENLVGELHGGALCFHQMMIPERMTSAGGSLALWSALDLAARYTNRRRAFGQEIRKYQAVSFMLADAITELDAALHSRQGRRQQLPLRPPAGQRGQKVRHRSGLERGQQGHADDGRHRVHRGLSHRAGHAGYPSVHDLDRHQRNHETAYPA